MGFSDNLKKYRKIQNMTQKDLADKMGVSLGAIRDWEQGLHVPRYPSMKLLSVVLSVPMDELTGLNDARTLEFEGEKFDKQTIDEALGDKLKPLIDRLEEATTPALKSKLLNNFNSLTYRGKIELIKYSNFLVENES